MNDVMLGKKRAKAPYYIKEIGKNVYSIEEINYYLYNYLYLADDAFFNEVLLEYIEVELKQPEIAEGVRRIISRGGSLGEKISCFIKKSGYYNKKEIEKLENHLVMLGSKTSAERTKAKADILMDGGKYNMAINYYQSILVKAKNSDLPDEFYGDVYNNRGVAHARLFEYDEAASDFYCAYRLNESDDTLKSMVLCDLLMGNETKLKSDMEKYSIPKSMVAELKKNIDDLKSDIENSWDESSEDEYIKKCKDEYIAELNG